MTTSGRELHTPIKSERLKPTMSIQQSLTLLANHFVDEIVEAIRRASLAEFTETERSTSVLHARRTPTAPRVVFAKKRARLARRTPEQIAATVDSIAELLRQRPEGMRAEHIRAKLDIDVREMPRVLREAVSSKAFRIVSGHKRSTVYGICAKKVPSKAAKKPAVKAPKKKTAKAPSKKSAAASKVKRAPGNTRGVR